MGSYTAGRFCEFLKWAFVPIFYVHGWQKIAGKFVPYIFNRLYPYSRPAFSALPPSMAVVCFWCKKGGLHGSGEIKNE